MSDTDIAREARERKAARILELKAKARAVLAEETALTKRGFSHKKAQTHDDYMIRARGALYRKPKRRASDGRATRHL